MKKKKYKKKMLNKKEYRDMITDICEEECCSEDRECILKEFLVELHPSPRLLLQMKCVRKFKKTINEEDWSEAMLKWIDKGYAEKFADAYKEGIKFSEIYKKIMQ